jgi:hypothetical protein
MRGNVRRWSNTSEAVAPSLSGKSQKLPRGVLATDAWREGARSLFSSWQRGLVTSIGALTGIGAMIFFMWTPFREDSVRQTAAVASEALGDYKVREQAVQLSKEVVENVLRDAKSVDLVVHVVVKLLEQEDTKRAVTGFIQGIFEDRYTHEVTKKFVLSIVTDPWIRGKLDEIAKDLVLDLLRNPSVKEALTNYLLASASDALRQPELHVQTAEAVRGTLYATINPWTASPQPRKQ